MKVAVHREACSKLIGHKHSVTVQLFQQRLSKLIPQAKHLSQNCYQMYISMNFNRSPVGLH